MGKSGEEGSRMMESQMQRPLGKKASVSTREVKVGEMGKGEMMEDSVGHGKGSDFILKNIMSRLIG